MRTELLLFALGAAFAFLLQVFVSRLALARDKRKEAWVRKLNSYENIYRAVTQLIDLLAAGIEAPDEQVWAAVGDARKSAHDAASYDPTHGERTSRMRELTLEFLLAYQRDEIASDDFGRWREEVQALRDAFYEEEGIR